MSDFVEDRYLQVLNRLTQQYETLADDKDAIVASTSIVATASTALTLIAIPVTAGEEVLISEVDVFTSTAAAEVEFLLSYNYTVSGVPFAQAKYYLVKPALSVMVFDRQPFSSPLMSVLAGGSFSITVKVLNPGAGGIYGCNVKFAVR